MIEVCFHLPPQANYHYLHTFLDLSPETTDLGHEQTCKNLSGKLGIMFPDSIARIKCDKLGRIFANAPRRLLFVKEEARCFH